MRRHRKDVVLSKYRKRSGQGPFPGSLSRLRATIASNERHDEQSVPCFLGAESGCSNQREKFRRRLPESLNEAHGTTQGVVELPLHMAGAGLTSYDMSKPHQHMGLYRTVLHEGLRDDLPHYLNRDLLLQMWPV
ncbi:hypothetical protein [Streptomyces sp. NPDC002788]